MDKEETEQSTTPTEVVEETFEHAPMRVGYAVYVFLFFFFSLVGFFVWSYAGYGFGSASTTAVDNAVHIRVGEEEVVATTVHLDRINPETQSLVLGQDAIFIVYSKDENAPQLQLSNQPVDVLWLSEAFTVVQGNRGNLSDASDISHTLVPPGGAVYGLVTRVGSLPDSVYTEGFQIIIEDTSELL